MTRSGVAGRRAEVGVVKVAATWWPPRIVSLYAVHSHRYQRNCFGEDLRRFVYLPSCKRSFRVAAEESHFDRPFRGMESRSRFSA